MRLLILFLSGCLTVLCQAREIEPLERRPATAQERLSFERYYRQQFAVAPEKSASVLAQRPLGSRTGWTLNAALDAPAVRPSGPLCKMSTANFVLTAQGKQLGQWRQITPDEQRVWSEPGAQCHQPAKAVLLLQALADGEVLALLAEHQALLQHARLLMAGNSSCAASRSMPFHLVAIGLAPPMAGKPAMQFIEFESDRRSFVRVWLRRSGVQLTAWGTECSSARAGSEL